MNLAIEQTPVEKMPASPEVLAMAKEKAKALKEVAQIRVGGMHYQHSYWVFNIFGGLFIGTMQGEDLPPFFGKEEQVYELRDKDNRVVATVQRFDL